MEQTRKKRERTGRKERLSISSFSLDFKEGRAGPSVIGEEVAEKHSPLFFLVKMANLEPAYTKVFETNESPLRPLGGRVH